MPWTGREWRHRYCDMLENFVRPKIEEFGQEHDPHSFWFQQDGATAHTARRSRTILQEIFPDFYLWGYLKAEVFKVRPRTLDDLKTAVEKEIVQITSKNGSICVSPTKAII